MIRSLEKQRGCMPPPTFFSQPLISLNDFITVACFINAIHVCTENPVHNAYSYETTCVKVGMKRAIEQLELNSVWQYLTKRQTNLLLVLKTYFD